VPAVTARSAYCFTARNENRLVTRSNRPITRSTGNGPLSGSWLALNVFSGGVNPMRGTHTPGAARDDGLRRLSRLTWRATQLSAITAVAFATLFARAAGAHTTTAVKPVVRPTAHATPSSNPSPSPSRVAAHKKRKHRPARHPAAAAGSSSSSPTTAPPSSSAPAAPPPSPTQTVAPPPAPPAPAPAPSHTSSGGSVPAGG